MLKRIVLLAAVATVALMNSAMAFDGNRRGFVLGGGLGIAPLASWNSNLPGNQEDQGAEPGYNIIIGYAWNQGNMIVFERNAIPYFETEISGAEVTVSQGFSGITWYHYFGQPGRSFFTAAGGGAYFFWFEDDDSDFDGTNDVGGAFLVGGGYEFLKHWQVGTYVAAGSTTTSQYDFDHVHINLLVGAVAF